jgi:tRNA(fMet)-specific endonuclease VapC
VIHVDTSFLVDVLRESTRGIRGPATVALDDIEGEAVRMGVHVVCELLAGAELSQTPSVERQRVARLCASLEVVYPDEQFPKVYARVLASLKRAGRQIATMDLLIATAALVDEAMLLTRNVKDFQRVPGLEVRGY